MPSAPASEISAARPLTQADLCWLTCPVCRGSLALTPSEPAGTAPQTIACTSCTRTYPVVDNLPILLADRATLPR